MKGWKKIFHTYGDQKKAGVAILISDKIDFEIKAVKRDKGHYIMIKESIQEENITIINIYAHNTGALQYVRQMLTNMKGEINSDTIIVGDFNTPLTPMDISTKQKISKETQTLNDKMDQLDLIDTYRTAAAAKSLQSCPTLCDPIDGSPLGSSVPGILQARILEWVAISFSNA